MPDKQPELNTDKDAPGKKEPLDSQADGENVGGGQFHVDGYT